MKNYLCLIVAFFIGYSPVQGVRCVIDDEFIRKDPLCQGLRKNLEEESEDSYQLEINLGSLGCAQLENISSFLRRLSAHTHSGKKISAVELKEGSSRKFNIMFPVLEMLVEKNPNIILHYSHGAGAQQLPRSAEKKLPTLKPGRVLTRVPFTWASYEAQINQALSPKASPGGAADLKEAQVLMMEAFKEERRDGFFQCLEGLELDDDGDFRTAMIELQKNEIISYGNQTEEEWERSFAEPEKVKVIRVTGVVEDFESFIGKVATASALRVIQFRESGILSSSLETLVEVMHSCPGLLYVDIREGLYRREPVSIFNEVFEALQKTRVHMDLLKRFVMVKDLSEVKGLETYLEGRFDKVGMPVDEIVRAQKAYLTLEGYFDFVLEG